MRFQLTLFFRGFLFAVTNPLAEKKENQATYDCTNRICAPVQRGCFTPWCKGLMKFIKHAIERHDDDWQNNAPFCGHFCSHAKGHPKGQTCKTNAVHQFVRIPKARHMLNGFLGRKIPTASKDKERGQPAKQFFQ